METIELHHCGPEALTEISSNRGLFDGCFFSVETCSNHGKVVTTIELDSREIARSWDLDGTPDAWTTALETVRAMPRYRRLTAEQTEELADAACNDRGDCELAISREGDDGAYRGWELQRIRGQIARALGFRAVEMSDEYGTSYLVLSM